MANNDITQDLSNVDYPATKQEIISAAKDNDADGDTLNALNGLPDKTYNSTGEVAQELS